MERRQFIRLVGGGTLAGMAATGLSGCDTGYPPEAVAPWKGPGAQEELRRWALGYAVLAPNSHNRQPWLVDLNEPNAITLYVDRTRLLPQTDPWFRQIVVSQGTFLELLVIALRERGIEPTVDLFPGGEFAPRQVDDRPVARLSWNPSGPGAARDPLFAQILRRHTAKVAYDTTRPVVAAHLQALAQVVPADAPAGLRHDHTVEPARLEELRRLCVESARVEVGTARTALESSQLMRVGPSEIAQHRDGISVNGLVPRMAVALGLFDRSQAPQPGSGAFDQVMKRFVEHSGTAMGFTWLSTDTAAAQAQGRTRSAEVWAGRAYVRQQLKATELGLQMHPMSQAPQEFAEMKPYYDQLHQQLVGMPASRRTVQMFCRVGYCADQAHTPRRGVDAVIRKTT